MATRVDIKYTEILSDKKFTLKNYEYDLTHNDTTISKKTEVYFRPDAVAVLLYDIDNETFILTSQFRLPGYLNGVADGYVIEACAGLVDEGETAESTAIREVEEETGYSVTVIEKVGEAFSSVGGIPEKLHLFVAAYTEDMKTGEGGGLENENEQVELVRISFTEARQKLKEGLFNDMKTILLLQHFFLYKI